MRQAGRQIGEVGQFRHEGAVDEHDAPRIHVADQLAGVLGARLGGRVRRAGERLRVADQRAEIGVFPLLDPPVRQAKRVEARGRGLAQRHDLAVARQLGLRGLVGIGQRLLGVGLHAAEFGVHDASAASPWNCA